MLVEILETVRSLARRMPAQAVSRFEQRSRLDHSKAVSQILDMLAHSGHLNAERSIQIRRQLARLPPRDLESVRRLVQQSTSEGGAMPDDAFLSVWNLMAAPAPADDPSSAPPAASGATASRAKGQRPV